MRLCRWGSGRSVRVRGCWRSRSGGRAGDTPSESISERSTPPQVNRSKAHKESNFSISACEYAAPTTRLDSRVGFLVGPFAGGGLRQKGGAELLSS